jgi:hypothetical protein
VRAVALVRRGTGASWRDAIGAFFIWQSTSLVVARASVLGLFAKKAAFLRTPKTSEQAKWWEALRANWAESSLALLGVLGMAAALTRYQTLAGPLLAALLLVPTLGMAAAPVNSWAAQRAALPADLREVRRTEWQRNRSRRAFVRGAALGGVVGVLGVVGAAAVLLLVPSPHKFNTPQLVPPAHSTKTDSPAPRHSHHATSSVTPSVSPSSTPSPTTSTPSPSPSSSSPSPSTSASGGT